VKYMTSARFLEKEDNVVVATDLTCFSGGIESFDDTKERNLYRRSLWSSIVCRNISNLPWFICYNSIFVEGHGFNK
jgi:hypothetical protein